MKKHHFNIEKMNYREQLKDPRWLKRRRKVKERDNHRCMLCGTDSGILNVHHLLYRNGRNAWEYNDTELATLCEDCHKWVHENSEELVVRHSVAAGKYWLCLNNHGESKIHAGTVLASDEMELIVACADVPLRRHLTMQNPDGSRIDPSSYPICEEVEAQVSVRKDGTGLAFNEYILPISGIGLRPATDEEKKILLESLMQWMK